MSVMAVLLNLLWIAFGGLWMAAGWVIAARVGASLLPVTTKLRGWVAVVTVPSETCTA